MGKEAKSGNICPECGQKIRYYAYPRQWLEYEVGDDGTVNLHSAINTGLDEGFPFKQYGECTNGECARKYTYDDDSNKIDVTKPLKKKNFWKRI